MCSCFVELWKKDILPQWKELFILSPDFKFSSYGLRNCNERQATFRCIGHTGGPFTRQTQAVASGTKLGRVPKSQPVTWHNSVRGGTSGTEWGADGKVSLRRQVLEARRGPPLELIVQFCKANETPGRTEQHFASQTECRSLATYKGWCQMECPSLYAIFWRYCSISRQHVFKIGSCVVNFKLMMQWIENTYIIVGYGGIEDCWTPWKQGRL